MSSWFYVQNGNRIGPVTQDVLIQMALNGQLGAKELVWTEGQADWQQADQCIWFCEPTAGESMQTSFSEAPPLIPILQNQSPANPVPPRPGGLLIQSILIMVCCGLPGIVGGIMGLIQDSKSKSAYAYGRYEQAYRANSIGQRWIGGAMLVTLIIVIVLGIINH